MIHFSTRLLRWYRRKGRDLPWRHTRDPYAIWISEIMLQQTQVATVIPYYRQFLRTYPTLRVLASAPLEDILKHWEGLGYYARARHLHQAARLMMERFDGQVPTTYADLYALPGVGRSTAGAIATLAFGQRHPVLDGNVRRVLCRYLGIGEDPKHAEAQLWREAERLTPMRSVDLYTHAIMDLGAICCTPKSPHCPDCPVRSSCFGYRHQMQTHLPLHVRHKPIPHYHEVVMVICKQNTVFIQQRPLEGLLGGLWEFPSQRISRNDLLGIEEETQRMLKVYGVQDRVVLHTLAEIRHAFTHFRTTVHVVVARIISNKNEIWNKRGLQFVSIRKLPDYPFSAVHRKIARQLAQMSVHPKTSALTSSPP